MRRLVRSAVAAAAAARFLESFPAQLAAALRCGARPRAAPPAGLPPQQPRWRPESRGRSAVAPPPVQVRGLRQSRAVMPLACTLCSRALPPPAAPGLASAFSVGFDCGPSVGKQGSKVVQVGRRSLARSKSFSTVLVSSVRTSCMRNLKFLRGLSKAVKMVCDSRWCATQDVRQQRSLRRARAHDGYDECTSMTEARSPPPPPWPKPPAEEGWVLCSSLRL